MGREVKGPTDQGVGHLVVVAPWFDRAACLTDHAAGVADFDWGCHGSIALTPISYSIGRQDRGSVTKLQKAIGSAVGAEMAA